MTYNFKEKRRHFDDLLAEQHVDSDIALLKKLAPDALKPFSNLSGNKLAREVLYALLDHATREDIIANRRTMDAPGDEYQAIIVEAKDLLISLVGKTFEEAAAISDQIKSLADNLSDEDKENILQSLENMFVALLPSPFAASGPAAGSDPAFVGDSAAANAQAAADGPAAGGDPAAANAQAAADGPAAGGDSAAANALAAADGPAAANAQAAADGPTDGGDSAAANALAAADGPAAEGEKKNLKQAQQSKKGQHPKSGRNTRKK